MILLSFSNTAMFFANPFDKLQFTILFIFFIVIFLKEETARRYSEHSVKWTSKSINNSGGFCFHLQEIINQLEKYLQHTSFILVHYV